MFLLYQFQRSLHPHSHLIQMAYTAWTIQSSLIELTSWLNSNTNSITYMHFRIAAEIIYCPITFTTSFICKFTHICRVPLTLDLYMHAKKTPAYLHTCLMPYLGSCCFIVSLAICSVIKLISPNSIVQWVCKTFCLQLTKQSWIAALVLHTVYLIKKKRNVLCPYACLYVQVSTPVAKK